MAESGSLQAVLFDAAGTLIATAESVGETYARAARAHGVDLPAEGLDDAFRRIHRRAPPMSFPGARPGQLPDLERGWWRDRVREIFRAADGGVQLSDFDDFDTYFAGLFEHYARPSTWRIRPGASEALAALRRAGLATGVVSNFDQRLIDILEGLDLACLLDVVIVSSRVGAAKPDPRIFQAALQRLGVPARRAAHVGDDPERDLGGARAAGLAAFDVAGLATLAELPARLRVASETP